MKKISLPILVALALLYSGIANADFSFRIYVTPDYTHPYYYTPAWPSGGRVYYSVPHYQYYSDYPHYTDYHHRPHHNIYRGRGHHKHHGHRGYRHHDH